jgi:plastocyanin
MIVGAIALQVSCNHAGRTLTTCGITPGSRSVTIAVTNNMLVMDPDTVRACPGDSIGWARASGTDTNTYTIQFNSSTADACGWNGGSQTIPVSCTVPASSPPTSGNGDKYTATCTSGCTGVAPLDPHVIIM